MTSTNILCLALVLVATPAGAASFHGFKAANLVVSVEGKGNTAGNYTDNQASPLSLFQFSHAGTASAAFVDALVLPQTASGANFAVSAEYGSSSEAILQLTGDGHHLTIAGYGVNAATFNANPTAYGTLTTDPTKPTALAQSGSLLGKGYIAVPRVAAVIGANGSVDSTTALYGVFNGNNPRSVWSLDGKQLYVSGQGVTGDKTGGVFTAGLGSNAASPITGGDTVYNGAAAYQDTRVVTGYNGQLYTSFDSKQGTGFNRSGIGTLGIGLPTGIVNPNPAAGPGQPDTLGPTALNGFQKTGKLTITAATTNGVNKAGDKINLSPEQYFFANATTLYVADSGFPKNDSNVSDGQSVGDGGLQKWSLISGTWTLDYTLSAGLGLVSNKTATAGTTGLLGLAGQVIGNQVQLFATTYTIGDTDPSFLYGITDDLLAFTKPTAERFTLLATAPADSNFKGVAFAPTAAFVPEPSTYAMLILGFGCLGAVQRRRVRVAA